MAPPQSDENGMSTERSPLLQDTYPDPQHETDSESASSKPTEISFDKEDPDDPRQWTRRRKMLNVAIIALMAILSPLASSMFTPGITEIAKDLDVETTAVVGATTGFVVFLGIGPLILAPLSETFGRRKLYMICFGLFSLLQIPTALSPNLECLIAVRTVSGFFGSVGISNGGGTISDMFVPEERAGVFGWCESFQLPVHAFSSQALTPPRPPRTPPRPQRRAPLRRHNSPIPNLALDLLGPNNSLQHKHSSRLLLPARDLLSRPTRKAHRIPPSRRPVPILNFRRPRHQTP